MLKLYSSIYDESHNGIFMLNKNSCIKEKYFRPNYI